MTVAGTPQALDDLLDLAVAVAGDAGELLTGYARRRGSLAVAAKSSPTDPVSEADHAAERLIADGLLAARPDDGLLGEEDAANRPGTSGLRWVVDPLDGTVNFLYGIPLWCVSIACEDADGGLVAVVHHPAVGETFVARRGGGASVLGGDGSRVALAVSDVPRLADALVATGLAYDPAVRADQGRFTGALGGHVRDIRRGGSAALDLAWVAAGRVDAYAEATLKPWDWAAGRLLVHEAGGHTSERAMRLAGTDQLTTIAGGARAHAALVAFVEAWQPAT